MVTGIHVDKTLCTRCGICSSLCPGELITPPGPVSLPEVCQNRVARCIDCGHCEVFCPVNALTRDHQTPLVTSPKSPRITPDLLTSYLLNRRSTRKFRSEPVDRKTLAQILEIARYAPTGGNGQPVEWLVISDPEKIRRVSELTLEWMKNVQSPDHPLGGVIQKFLDQWEKGIDGICRGAPHLILAHIPADYHFPRGKPMAFVDAIIALTHVDIAAQAFGVGTCWAGLLAMAAAEYPPLKEFLGFPPGRELAYALMAGYPKYHPRRIPERKVLSVEWR
ncbi:nitroreductase family protein [uncultured Methanospirillum sp.]|uniref:nitroreductase family protein n=1 Tax=uncultured Methanospirillum sp. TaxID=262503 RepID=UPI0029C8DDC1|nr:nitroreductase family protein [uncultured Methanospirillum sp.]